MTINKPDLTKLKEMEARLEACAKLSVVVGIPAATNTTREGGISQAELAAVMEFGDEERGLVERSYLRSTLSEKKQKYTDNMAKQTKKVVKDGIDPKAAFALVGEDAAADVKMKITNGDFAPLKEATIKRKGSSKPLIDEGQLRQDISSEVRDV